MSVALSWLGICKFFEPRMSAARFHATCDLEISPSKARRDKLAECTGPIGWPASWVSSLQNLSRKYCWICWWHNPSRTLLHSRRAWPVVEAAVLHGDDQHAVSLFAFTRVEECSKTILSWVTSPLRTQLLHLQHECILGLTSIAGKFKWCDDVLAKCSNWKHLYFDIENCALLVIK